ncbi:MAG TPA: hypothetical protein VGE14_09805 [Marmoricola sp.]
MDANDTLATILRRLRRDVGPARRHRWDVATASTPDGATVEVHVEYVVVLAKPDHELETAVSDAVEERIRQTIRTTPLVDLPAAGDDADWAEGDHVGGAVVEHAVVVRSDVQVTAELRRIVTGSFAGPAPWT